MKNLLTTPVLLLLPSIAAAHDGPLGHQHTEYMSLGLLALVVIGISWLLKKR